MSKPRFFLRISRRFLILLNLGFIGFSLFPSNSYGQDLIKIRGRVYDANGPISGAIVYVEGNPLPVQTDQSGAYRIANLENGVYRLRCEYGNSVVRVMAPVRVSDGPPAECDIFFDSEVLQLAPIVVEFKKSDDFDKAIERRVYNIDQGVRNVEDLVGRIVSAQIIASPGEISFGLAGSRPQDVEILLDGKRLNSSLTGKADLNQLPVKAIRKIELFKAGTINDGGGLAAIINFITEPNAIDNNLTIEHSRGSFGLEKYSLTSALKTGRYGALSVCAEYDRRRDNYPYIDYFGIKKNLTNAQSEVGRVYVSGSHRLSGGKVNYSALLFHNESGLPGQIIQPNHSAKQLKRTLSVGIDYIHLLGRQVETSAGISHTRRQLDHFDSDSWIKYDSRYNESEIDIHFLVETYMNKFIRINNRFSYRRESLEGIDRIRTAYSLGRHSRDIFGNNSEINFNHELSVFNLRSFLGGGFNVINSRFHGSDLAGISLSLSKKPYPSIMIYRSDSFRLPGLADLNWREDVFAIPNPDLKPERSMSKGIELAAKGDLLGSWRLSAEYKESKYTDLISWRRSQGIKYKPVNISSSDFYGLIISLNYYSPGQVLALDLSRVQSLTINRELGQPYFGKLIIYQPPYVNRLSATVNYRELLIKFDLKDVGRRFYLEENTKALAPYLVIDLEVRCRLRYRFGEVELSGRIENCTNEIYELVEYQPMPPRSFEIGCGIFF